MAEYLWNHGNLLVDLGWPIPSQNRTANLPTPCKLFIRRLYINLTSNSLQQVPRKTLQIKFSFCTNAGVNCFDVQSLVLCYYNKLTTQQLSAILPSYNLYAPYSECLHVSFCYISRSVPLFSRENIKNRLVYMYTAPHLYYYKTVTQIHN